MFCFISRGELYRCQRHWAMYMHGVLWKYNFSVFPILAVIPQSFLFKDWWGSLMGVFVLPHLLDISVKELWNLWPTLRLCLQWLYCDPCKYPKHCQFFIFALSILVPIFYYITFCKTRGFGEFSFITKYLRMSFLNEIPLKNFIALLDLCKEKIYLRFVLSYNSLL